MAINEIEWLSPEIIQELLAIDDDIEESPAVVANEASLGITDEAVNMLLKDITDSKLSSFGLANVSVWIKEYNKKKNKENLVSQYSKFCIRASDFFLPEVSDPSYVLLQIIERIAKPDPVEDVLKGGEITGFEGDTLEYLGGYSLKKAVEKFGINEITKVLCVKPRPNSLIATIEKKTGSLYCPSEELFYFLQHIYLKLASEFSRSPTNIDISVFAETIRQDQYFFKIAENIYLSNQDLDYDLLEEILTHIVNTVIKLLGRGFAKKLFERIRSKCMLTKGLRGNLKLQTKGWLCKEFYIS